LGITLLPVFLKPFRKTGSRVGLSALALFLFLSKKKEKGAQTNATIPYAFKIVRIFDMLKIVFAKTTL